MSERVLTPEEAQRAINMEFASPAPDGGWEAARRRERKSNRAKIRRRASSLGVLEGRTVERVSVEVVDPYPGCSYPSAQVRLTLAGGDEVVLSAISMYYDGEMSAPIVGELKAWEDEIA